MNKEFERGYDEDTVVERKVSDDGYVFCEHCGDLEDKIYYYDGCEWCIYCAHANGYTSDAQLEIDKKGV